MPQRLTDTFCRTVRHSGATLSPERHTDDKGFGLMLAVAPSGSKRWVQRVTVRGVRRTLGHGGYPVVTLKEARRRALEVARHVEDGGDPTDLRRRKTAVPTFAAAAAEVIRLREPAWKAGSSTAAHWRSTLETYAFPVVGAMPVDAITSADVLSVVAPIWTAKRETAARVRRLVSAVLRWCVAQGHRADDPAGSAVLQALPAGTGQAPRHHRALHYDAVPDAVQRIRASLAWTGTKLAFEFLVLTAARSGEVRGATWAEIDHEARTWTVPAERMKAGTPHRVPLSDACLEVLAEAKAITEQPMTPAHAGCPLVFPSVRAKPMSDSTMSKLLREQGISAVPHGFRSSFRDWAAERTSAPHAVMEAALAHTIPNAAERAYARSDLYERRRTLMDEWAAHVRRESGTVAEPT